MKGRWVDRQELLDWLARSKNWRGDSLCGTFGHAIKSEAIRLVKEYVQRPAKRRKAQGGRK